MCVCCVDMCGSLFMKARGIIGFLGTRVTGGCELLGGGD